MNDRLKSLYQTVILQKAKEEKYQGHLEEFTFELKAYNPLCGDKFNIQILVEDNTLMSLKYNGSGCSISKASTAVLCEYLEGSSIQTIAQKIDMFLELVDADSPNAPEELTKDETLLAFAAARDFPERKTCADLSWRELEKQIANLSNR